jgi:RNA-directed DNA polymerase
MGELLEAGQSVFSELKNVCVCEELSRYLKGWGAYFGFCETPSALRGLDHWTRRRLRAVPWKQ